MLKCQPIDESGKMWAYGQFLKIKYPFPQNKKLVVKRTTSPFPFMIDTGSPYPIITTEDNFSEILKTKGKYTVVRVPPIKVSGIYREGFVIYETSRGKLNELRNYFKGKILQTADKTPVQKPKVTTSSYSLEGIDKIGSIHVITFLNASNIVGLLGIKELVRKQLKDVSKLVVNPKDNIWCFCDKQQLVFSDCCINNEC